MKKYILPLMSIAMLMAMASCSSSDDEVAEIKEESKLVPMTFTATQESNVGTRSALNGSNGVDWQTSDMISVFDAVGDGHNQRFTLTGDATEGIFSGEASSEATSFTAVYPYTDGAQLESDGIVSGITLPAEQTATPNSFDPKAALMMAYSTDKSKLDFKNVVSLVKVTTDFPCKKIVLTAIDNIAGTGKLTYNNGEPSIALETNKSQTVTLKPASEDGVIDAGNYYIAICPLKDTRFSISFINSTDTKAYTKAYTQTSSKYFTFQRREIKNLGTFSESGTSWTSTIESNGNVKASQQVDLGLTIKQGGKTYKVIFAKSNLTDKGLAEKETDYGDYFAWGAKEPWYSSFSGNNFTWKPGKPGGYTDDNAPYYNNGYYKYTRDGDILEPSDDAANVILHGDWQLPTKNIWVNLKEVCRTMNYSAYFTPINGCKGCQVMRMTGNIQYIFLPAAGHIAQTWFNCYGSKGYYWTGTGAENQWAWHLGIDPDQVFNFAIDAQSWSPRRYGYSVRPVRLVAE
ncbi:hypothetical protein I6E23_12845 [Prevotella brevis]|nr:hypothetical protein [Xylanibacter brevis]